MSAPLPRLPDFFIIGAAKAGTTTLFDLLRQHPDVYVPFAKEPAFFSDDDEYARGVDWYRRTYFEGAAAAHAAGEATSMYLAWGTKVVPRLLDLYGDTRPRIIAIFRDPVALTYSYYWHSVREGREPLTFRDALAAEPARLADTGDLLRRRGRIQYAYRGMARYATQLQPYLAHFPQERCLFLLTDDLRDETALMRRTEAFLGLAQAPHIASVASNRAARPRYPRLRQWLRGPSALKDACKPFMPASMRHALKERMASALLEPFTPPPIEPDLAAGLRRHYADEMRQLERLISRDLSAWYAGV